MAILLNMDTNEEITPYISISGKQDVIKTIQKTLYGATHIQRIGQPNISYEITAYVDEQGIQKLMYAEDKTSLLKAELSKGVFYGRITELKDFDNVTRNYYKTVITLAQENDE